MSVKAISTKTFTAVLHKEEDMYVATELYLEEFPVAEGSKPLMTVFEVTESVKA